MGYTVTIVEAKPRWIAASKGAAKEGEIFADDARAVGTRLGAGQEIGHQNGRAECRDLPGRHDRGWVRDCLKSSDGDCVATPSGLLGCDDDSTWGRTNCSGGRHGAVRDWCKAGGHELEGTNWEVYGHHEEDPAKRRTDVYYLLRT